MRIDTKIFGTIEVADEKIIRFENGIIGFPELKSFTLLHDEEKGTGVGIRFLQSVDEPAFAMPVMDPLLVSPDYDPEVEDELLTCIGQVNGDNILVLVTATIPSDLTQMSVNLQGPIIINVDERRGCQIIVDSTKYPVKFPIYELLRKAGE